MTWDRVALVINDILGILVIVHLFRLRLHHVYSFFALFVFFDLAFSSAFAFDAATKWVDYRKLFIAVEILTWILTFCLVYSLLNTLLAKLPGILKFSRYLLNFVFAIALVFAFVLASHALSSAHASFDGSVRSLVIIVLVLQPLVATISLITFVLMLAFVLWFPVELPRNLAFFSFALVAYFAAETMLLLIRKLVSGPTLNLLSIVDLAILCGCFLFLIVKLTRDGDRVTVRMGHGWEKNHQVILIEQLEAMDASLTRTARQL